ncbi:MAG: hypothetical protein HY720_03245 [Planctomycetes bacterium]|nr:hypothetical protein [Planctomycetota bacterium]
MNSPRWSDVLGIIAVLAYLALAFVALGLVFVSTAAADDEPAPEKKGESTKKEEVSADDEWIEKWEPGFLTRSAFSWVSGDDERYRYYFQEKEKLKGGVSEFSARRLEDDGDLQFYGKGLYKDEMGVGGRFEKFGWGYIESSFEQYPRYYDSSDVDYYWEPQKDELPGELQLDLGRFALEGGFQRADLPRVTVGYERFNRDGETDLPYGGQQVPDFSTVYGDPLFAPRNYPADLFHAYVTPLERRIDTIEDHVYTRVSHTIGPVDLSARADWREKRGEEALDEPWFLASGASGGTTRPDQLEPPPTAINTWRWSPQHDVWLVGANAQIRAIEDVLKFEFDYQYTGSGSDSQLRTEINTPEGVRYRPNHGFTFLPGTDANNRAREHRLKGRVEATPIDAVTAWYEMTYTNEHTKGDSKRLEDITEATAPPANASPLLADEIWDHDTFVVEKTWREEVGLRVTGIPMTTMTLISAFEQSDVDYDWHADFQDGPDVTVVPDQGNWYWDADGDYQRFHGTARLTFQPADWVAFRPHYQFQDSDYEVNENDRYYERKVGDPEYTVNDNARYYPGQIKDTYRYTHTVGMSVDLTPVSSVTFRPRFEYRRLNEVNHDQTYDDKLGRFRSTELGLAIDLVPVEHLTLNLDGSTRWSETRTPANKYSFSTLVNSQSGVGNQNGWRGGMVDKFESNYWSVAAGANYELDDWTIGCNFTHTNMDGSWETRVVTAQAGVDYKISKHWRSGLLYQFGDYDERNNSDHNDFGSHTALIGVEFR